MFAAPQHTKHGRLAYTATRLSRSIIPSITRLSAVLSSARCPILATSAGPKRPIERLLLRDTHSTGWRLDELDSRSMKTESSAEIGSCRHRPSGMLSYSRRDSSLSRSSCFVLRVVTGPTSSGSTLGVVSESTFLLISNARRFDLATRHSASCYALSSLAISCTWYGGGSAESDQAIQIDRLVVGRH